MCRTASHSGYLNGITTTKHILGETPDISEYPDLNFYNGVWFKQDSGLGKTRLGRWIGVSDIIGFLMSYWVLPDTGVPEVITTVQMVKKEKYIDEHIYKFKYYNDKIYTRFKKSGLVPNGKPINQYKWEQLVDDNDALNKEF